MRSSSFVELVLVSANAVKIRAFCGLRSGATTQSYSSSGFSVLRKFLLVTASITSHLVDLTYNTHQATTQ